MFFRHPGCVFCLAASRGCGAALSRAVTSGVALPAASCGGAPYSYSASFDKTSYAPGEIATLSVTFKDKGGSLASDESAIATHVSAGVSDASISAPGLTMVGAPTSVDRTTNGVKKY